MAPTTPGVLLATPPPAPAGWFGRLPGSGVGSPGAVWLEEGGGGYPPAGAGRALVAVGTELGSAGLPCAGTAACRSSAA